MTNDIEAKRQTAAYADTLNKIRHFEPGVSDEEADRRGLRAVDEAVFGHDAKKDRSGAFIQQGVGSPGHESANHFASLRRYQGEEAWRRAVAEIYKRDPQRAAALNLPKPTA
jgi:hypothetical protein